MPRPGRLGQLVDELKRRKVFRAAALYLAAAFILLQVADLVFQAEFMPAWGYSAIVLLAGLGLPVALVLAWAFDWTPEGVRRSEGTATQARTDQGTIRLARLILVLVVVAATGAAGLVAWDGLVRPAREEGTVAAVPASSLDPLRIAVLYLENRTRQDSLDYLARGLTEGLIHELGRVDSLTVASRNAVETVLTGRMSVDALMTQLGAGTYVDGTLSRAGNELRVNLQLVDARTGYQLSTHSLARPVGEALALRDTLVTELSEAVRRRLGVEVRARSLRAAGVSEASWTQLQRAERIVDDASALWDRGRDALETALDRADSLLARAETGSPGWVEPILARGWLEHTRARFVSEIPGQLAAPPVRRGLDHAERALATGPGDRPAALELRGTLRSGLALRLEPGAEQDRMLRRAEEDLAAAVEARPGLARAWWELSEVLRRRGDFDRSLEAAERALREDAFLEEAHRVYRQLFYTAFEQEQHARAAHWCAEGHRRFPGRPDLILCRVLVLATVDTIPPDPAAVAATADTLVRAVSPADSAAWRSYATMQQAKVYARAGMVDSAEALIRRAHGGNTQTWLRYDEAHARLLLDQRDSALALLRADLATQPDRGEYWVRDWWLRDLWTDPRFLEMVEPLDDD